MPSKRGKPAKRKAASRGAAGARKSQRGKQKRASGHNATVWQEILRRYPDRVTRR